MTVNINRMYELTSAYCRHVAQATGGDLSKLPLTNTGVGLFSISPPQETALRLALMEANWFLPLIHVRETAQIRGQVIDVGNPGLFTGRKQGRYTKDVGVSGNTYQLYKTDMQLAPAINDTFAPALEIEIKK